MLVDAGHDVVGLDTNLYERCTFGQDIPQNSTIRKDIRDIEAADLVGFEAVIDLAALSNDPLGNINPDLTYAINHQAPVRPVKLAKAADAIHFLYSSCSTYGAAGKDMLTEEAAFSTR